MQFDAWYNDHFFGRDAMIYLYNYIKFFISPNGENDKAMVGENGFLWSKAYNSVDMYSNNNLFTYSELKKVGENIERFVKNAHAAGVKNIYFMLSNDKESVYPEFYPSYIKQIGKVSRLEQILNYIHSKYPFIRFLNFRDKFEDIKKKENVFYKTGTHMNNIGAYYEYYFLANEIKKDYPEINVLSIDNFDIIVSEDLHDIDIYKRFMVLPRYAKNNFVNKIIKYKNINSNIKIKYAEREFGSFINVSNDKASNGLRVFVMSDSFLGEYSTYLYETFSKVDKIFWGDGKDFILSKNEQEYLLNNIPDIIIIGTTERFLQRFLTIEFPKNLNSSTKEN